jgi:hypothetical protein
MSRSGEAVEWESAQWRDSESTPGVRFKTVKMTLARRRDLTSRVRSMLNKARFHALSGVAEEEMEASLLSLDADRMLLDWGLLEVTGLRIDGEAACVRSLIEAGPEELCREIAERIRHDCQLTEQERKN